MKQKQIDNLNILLEKMTVVNKSQADPADSFATYLENKLKAEFAQRYAKEKKTFPWSFFSQLTFPPRYALFFVTILIFIIGAVSYSSRTAGSRQLASLNSSITGLEKDLTLLDKEFAELTLLNQEIGDEDKSDLIVPEGM